MSVNIPLLAQKVSGKEANVRVHVRPGIVDVERGRTSVGSVVVTATNDRQALFDPFPPDKPHPDFIYFPFVI